MLETPEPQEVELNKIATELITRSLNAVAEAVADHAKDVTAELRVRIGTAFTRYLDEQLRRRSKVRTILYREDPQFLYDFYVPQDVQCGENPPLLDVTSRSLIPASFHTILTGTGGLGKSFLLRHILIDLIRFTDYVPIFVELKAVNDNGTTFEQILFKELDLASAKLTPAVMIKALKKGAFALLLDGFDEVVLEKQDAVAKAIRALAGESPHTPIIVTSRHDERFVGWEGFRQFRLLPLTLDKVKSLVGRLKYNEQVKIRFLADVEATLWNTHQSFLSNPLLLTIMLLTYSHNASVPSRMHLFYSQVFETLWNRHDAAKDGYQRVLESKIEKDVFLRILEAFAFKTYWDSKVTLSDGEVHDALAFAIGFVKCSCDVDAYLRDLIKAICLLNQDGLLYTFTHRSFQEYYAARFLVRASPVHRAKLISRIAASAQKDQVLSLMWEMDRSLIEREVVLPFLEGLERTIDTRPANESRAIAFAKFWCKVLLVYPAHQLFGQEVKHEVTGLLNFTMQKYFAQQWSQLRTRFPNSSKDAVLAFIQKYAPNSPTPAMPGTVIRIPIDQIDEESIALLAKFEITYSEAALDFFLQALTRIRADHAAADKSLESLLSSDLKA